jgi:hypothetical protein
MVPLSLEAFGQLLRFDLYLSREGFAAVYRRVRDCQTADVASASTELICAAVDMASIWYWKQVRCLQRSAATVCLLRAHGIPAHLVIGAQQVPFRSHAWVEVDGKVVNDKPYVPETYLVLDKC